MFGSYGEDKTRFLFILITALGAFAVSPVSAGGSLFTGGEIPRHFAAGNAGAYHDDGYGAMENGDIRYADQVNKPNSKIIYGLSLRHAPTVQAEWSTVPPWGYPARSPALAAPGDGPDATFLESAPGTEGVGGYVFLKNLFYVELSGYRTADRLILAPGAGNTYDPIADRSALKSYHPYWRLALNKDWGSHSAMVGYYGIDARQYAGFTQGDQPTTRYFDQAFDARYQYNGSVNLFTAQMNYIHEKRDYDSGPGATSGRDHQTAYLNSFKTRAAYYYKKTYGGSIGYFSTIGDKDVTAYGFASANGRPVTRGFIYELDYQPIENIRLSARYTDYRKFNGGPSYFDIGAPGGRHASDNNTLYFYGWIAY